MEAPGDSPDPTRPVPDKQGQVYLSDGESLNRMVPVIYSVYNEQLWNALMDPAGATVLLEVGPNVGVRPAGVPSSLAGARFSWVEEGELLGLNGLLNGLEAE
eukprot:g17686.t1